MHIGALNLASQIGSTHSTWHWRFFTHLRNATNRFLLIFQGKLTTTTTTTAAAAAAAAARGRRRIAQMKTKTTNDNKGRARARVIAMAIACDSNSNDKAKDDNYGLVPARMQAWRSSTVAAARCLVASPNCKQTWPPSNAAV